MAKEIPEKSCHILGGQQTMLDTTLGGQHNNASYHTWGEIG
jgi:hypothetical protein